MKTDHIRQQIVATRHFHIVLVASVILYFFLHSQYYAALMTPILWSAGAGYLLERNIYMIRTEGIPDHFSDARNRMDPQTRVKVADIIFNQFTEGLSEEYIVEKSGVAGEPKSMDKQTDSTESSSLGEQDSESGGGAD